MWLRNFRLVAPTVVLLACLAQAQDPQTKPTTGQRIGEKLDEAYQEARGGLRKAGDSVKEQFSKSKSSVHNMGGEGRVYGRLHWDKSLRGATIDLAMSGPGVITLEGTVATEKAKLRAVDLAQETEGVEQVVDHLAIRPAGQVTTPEKP